MLSHTTTIRMLILVVSIVIAKHVPLACLVSERIVTNVLSVANSSSDSRAVCECDRKLVNFLFDSVAANSNYNANDCEIGGYADTDCCNWDTFMYANYNIDTHCCGADGVKEIGSC